MPGVALQDIHTLLAQDTARVHRESSNATESLLRVLDDPPPPGSNPPSQRSPQHPAHPPTHLGPGFANHSQYSSNNISMSSPASPNGTPAKQRLSNEQKKKNHIESEKKRRDAIRAGFDKLADIVPKMHGQGRSEAVVLQHTVAYMKYLISKREALDKIADEKWTPEQRNNVYLAAEAEIRRKDDALEIAAQQAQQAAQHAARKNQMGPR